VSNDLKSVVGVRVKAARKSAGLTQAQLAEAVNRTIEAVSNIERGKSLPPLNLLERIAAATNCQLPALVAVPEDAQSRTERADLEMRLLAAGRALPIEQLRVAAVQIEALRPQE
jgi:transcriptional regulator with XRE-family HTH domain